MKRVLALGVVLLLLSGCGPSLCCHRTPLRKQWFEDAYWYTVDYVNTDGTICGSITKRETWNSYLIFTGYGTWARLKNGDDKRTYSLEEAEREMESRYCKL